MATHTQVPGADVVCWELLGIRVVSDRWAPYVCGALDRRTHVLDIGEEAPRTLVKGEAYWWAHGFAHARGCGDQVAAVRQQPVPELLSMDEAGERVPAIRGNHTLTGQGVRKALAWYPVNVPHPPGAAANRGGRSRYVFAAQVDAEAAARRLALATGITGAERRKLRAAADRTEARWQVLLAKLPPLVKMTKADRDITPAASPDPLPIPQGQTEATRRAAALRVGHSEGWFVYRRPTPDGFVVTLDEAGDLELPAAGVLPWVLGFADAVGDGAAALVAYRPGLG